MSFLEFCKKNKKTFFTISLILISLFGLYLRFDQRANTKLGVDDLFQIGPMHTSLSAALNSARQYLQFPGDCILIYPFFLIFGENKWGLAIPHIIITILGFYLLYVMCSKYFKTFSAYIITFLIFAFNVNLIYHSFEIRPYSVLVVLSMAIFIVLRHIFVQKEFSLFKKSLIMLFIFISALFHFYCPIILFFTYIYHLIFSRKEEGVGPVILRHLKQFGLVLLLTVPFWLYFMHVDKKQFENQGINTFQYIPFGMVSLLKGIFGNLIGVKKLYILALGIIFAFFIPHKERHKQVAFFIILIIIPIFLVLISSIYFKYWFIQRLFIWAMPLFAFLIGWCWDSLIIKGKQLFEAR